VLGKGHFGLVLKGVFKDLERNEKMDVAVKTLKTKTDVSALKSLLSELKIMATVGKNLNVVNLIGACTKRMQKGNNTNTQINFISFIH
jgi:FMS-like tyrosine kinase 1